jgi:hypothetical protein
MSKRPWLVFVLFAVFVLVVGAACSAGGDVAPTAEPTEEPVVLPTSEPEPTAELPKPALPTKGAAPVGPAPFEIDSNVYVHPSGIFSFNPPVGWSVDETDSDVLMVSPDGKGTLYFSATNAGIELDTPSFENFIYAREANFFGGRPDYVEQDYQINDAGTAIVKKTFSFDNIPQYVFTFYLKGGQGLFAFDFWADADAAEAYNPGYVEIANSINFDGTNVVDFAPYNFIYTYTDPNGLFEFQVPTGWTYAYDEGENYYTDTFTSPDGQSLIENITYDDGTPTSKTQAGALARLILNEGYTNGANDIRVIDDKVQPDGSERLTWESRSGGFSGQSFFETRGTTFLMLTYLVTDGYGDIYGPVWENTLSTYAIP